jgi:nitrogen-specific signal transduction histidine kinase
MASDLETGRARALEAERLRAFRETARQVAHELKNPLTPIRLAVTRLQRESPPGLAETIEVLGVESARLESMARSFAQFGRLPEGPAADVDIAEMVRYVARSTVPEEVPLKLEIDDGLPLVAGHHDALARALSNVLLNAVDACGPTHGSITVTAERANGAVQIRVRVSGSHTRRTSQGAPDSGSPSPARPCSPTRARSTHAAHQARVRKSGSYFRVDHLSRDDRPDSGRRAEYSTDGRRAADRRGS